jgi:hypothetical protein
MFNFLHITFLQSKTSKPFLKWLKWKNSKLSNDVVSNGMKNWSMYFKMLIKLTTMNLFVQWYTQSVSNLLRIIFPFSDKQLLKWKWGQNTNKNLNTVMSGLKYW